MKTKNLHFVLLAFAAFTFHFFTFKVFAQVCFSPTNNFVVGTNPRSVMSVDFNGDGNADIVTANFYLNTVSILLGNGAGSFGTATDFAVGTYPCSSISADFNGDGKADLAIANSNSSNVSVLLGDGLGGMGLVTNYNVDIGPTSVISSDFNGDGNTDLAIACATLKNVSVLLGDGLGGFGTATNFDVGHYWPISVTSADFNTDGKIDLAVASWSSDTLSILLGDGVGNFVTSTIFPMAVYYPASIISTDFDGDGKADLAVANAGSNNVSVLLGNGAGNFGSTTNFTVDNSPYSITNGDFNGDGKDDLAAANQNSNNISVLLGNGAGNFGSPTNFVVGTKPYSLTSGDFNGDGKTDLAVANQNSNNVSLLLNNPLPVTANANVNSVCPGTPVTLTGGGASTYTWTGGVSDGVAFAAPSSSTAYTVTGTTAGCSYSATKTITVHPLPTATFTTQNESSTLYCDGSIKAHLSGGTGIIQAQWDSAQTVLALVDSIGGLCPGIYTLHLTDANSCTNSYTKAVQSGTMPQIPPICLISLDYTNSHNIVVWEKANLNMTTIDSFVVYREISTNSYQAIGAVSKDSLSTFDDFSTNPASTAYRYKLKSKNTQGVVSFFSDYHNTIYLTNTGANFSWTPYQIENSTTPVSNYYIYRDDNSTGNFQTIGNTTGNQFGFTDANYSSYPNAQYYVEAVMVAGACQPTRTGFTASRSNVKHFGISGIQQLNNHSVVNIYPNPAGNTLNITGITGKATVLLYDVVGKLVLEKEVVNNTILNTSNLGDGIYTLLTEIKMGRSYNKVVISR